MSVIHPAAGPRAVDAMVPQPRRDSDREGAEAAPSPDLVLDADGTAADVSDAWCRAASMSRAASAGLGWLLPVHAGDRERLLEAVVLTCSGMLPACVVTAEVHGRARQWRLEGRGDRVLAVVGPPLEGGATGEHSRTGSEPPTPDLVRELFAVSMDLAACAGALDDPWRRRLVAAIHRLDRVGDALRGRGRAPLE